MTFFHEEEIQKIDFVRVDDGGTVICVRLRANNSHKVGHWIGYADQIRVISAK